MPKCLAELVSLSPYSQSQNIDFDRIPELKGESPGARDERLWREKMHYDANDDVFIPQEALTFALQDAAAYLGQKIKGRGTKTYKSSFMAGVMIAKPPYIGHKKNDVTGKSFYVHANGQRNSGSRVWRKFPMFYSWSTLVEFDILDPALSEDVFETHLRAAGLYAGIGRYRPSKGGSNGRFRIAALTWTAD